ncbi:MAG TPA: DUF2911 domain-containing protein [Blastocatellia bacterium]|nr:DUF2911 domain-containing protein [Blastocatellia bacterium]
MKRLLLVMTIGLFALGAAWVLTNRNAEAAASAHEPGEDETSVALGKGKVTIHYGTPKLAGRNLDEMIKPGLAWFMGMNNPTTLETTVALDFNGKKLHPGKYAIFSRPDELRNWTLLVSSAIARPLKPETVVLEAPLKFAKDGAPQDLLKITLEKAGEGASLVVAWGSYRLQGAFKAAS